MKNKIYIAELNEYVKHNISNATISYPNAQTDPTKPNCLYAMVTEGTDYIGVGYETVKTFYTWDEAAEYANSLTEEAFIGIRESGNMRYTRLATINEGQRKNTRRTKGCK